MGKCKRCKAEAKEHKISDFKNGVYVVYCSEFCNEYSIMLLGMDCFTLCYPSVGIKKDSSGREHYRNYCTRCNETQGQMLPKREHPNVSKYVGDCQHEIDRIYEEFANMKERYKAKVKDPFWTAYNSYLNTEQWKAKRRYILSRDNYTCQGCMNAKAEEVHHINYINIGQELYCDLVSLCKVCHDRHTFNSRNKDSVRADFIEKYK